MSPFQSSGSSFFLDPLKEAVQDLCGCSVFRSVLKASADMFSASDLFPFLSFSVAYLTSILLGFKLFRGKEFSTSVNSEGRRMSLRTGRFSRSEKWCAHLACLPSTGLLL